MVFIRSVDPVKAVPQLLCTFIEDGQLPPEWTSFCKERGLVVLVAEAEGELLGFTIAESHPNVVHVLSLEGDDLVCHLLLQRVARLAGERNLSGWFPIDQATVLARPEWQGFTRHCLADIEGRLSFFCYWERNEV